MTTKTTVFKAVDDEERIVWSEVYAPLVPDTDNEYMTAEDIKKMAYKFMRDMKLDQVDSFHNNEIVPDSRVVESFIVRPGDPTFIEGAWVVGIHVPDDETWEKIKSGEINGFSMEAMVVKTPMEVTLDMPPQLQGITLAADDGHEHRFTVTYDAQGNFMGGYTDQVDGHSHTISTGTITDKAAGHTHRFSHVENVQITSETELS